MCQNQIILQWFYEHFWLAPVDIFALVLALKTDLAAQASVENDFSIFTRYVISMLDIISVFLTSVFAAQA